VTGFGTVRRSSQTIKASRERSATYLRSLFSAFWWLMWLCSSGQRVGQSVYEYVQAGD
jgi:hypothetical protein